MSNNLVPLATSTLPSPQGQRPAIARTSVLLPVPDSPATRTPLARGDRHLRILDHFGAVLERNRQIAQAQRRLLGFAALDAPHVFALFAPFEIVERNHERRHAPGRGGPIRQSRIVVHQPVESTL